MYGFLGKETPHGKSSTRDRPLFRLYTADPSTPDAPHATVSLDTTRDTKTTREKEPAMTRQRRRFGRRHQRGFGPEPRDTAHTRRRAAPRGAVKIGPSPHPQHERRRRPGGRLAVVSAWTLRFACGVRAVYGALAPSATGPRARGRRQGARHRGSSRSAEAHLRHVGRFRFVTKSC